MVKKVLVLLSCITLVWLIARPYHMSGDCMEPAFKDGTTQFINQLAPYIRSSQLNDVIIFNYENKPWIARIVGLSGDTIELNEHKIMLNNVELKDAVIRNWSEWNYGTYGINTPFTIPQDHVYVLSDNLSAHHDDSRVFGPIPYSTISGLVW